MNDTVSFEILFKKIQDCYTFNDEILLNYFDFQFDELLNREEKIEKREKIAISTPNLGIFLNQPLFIAQRIHKFIFNKNTTDLKESFSKGMKDIFFGSFEKICKIIFKIFDLSESNEIFPKDVRLILNYLILDLKVHGNVDQIIFKFFQNNSSLNFEEFIYNTFTINCDIFVVFLLGLYQNQPFTQNSLKHFNDCFSSWRNAHSHKKTKINDVENINNFNNKSITNSYLKCKTENKNSPKYEFKTHQVEFSISFEETKKLTTIRIIEEETIIDFSEILDLNEMWREISFNADYDMEMNKTKMHMSILDAKTTDGRSLKPDSESTKLTLSTKDTKTKSVCETYTLYTINNTIRKCYQAIIIDDTLFITKKKKEKKYPTIKQIIHLPSLLTHQGDNIKLKEQIYSPIIFTNKCFNYILERIYYFKCVLKRNNFYERLCEVMNIRKVNYDFIFKNEIGRGNFGKISLAENIYTGEKVAIKKIKKRKFEKYDNEILISELNVSKFLMHHKHENIINILDFYENRKNIYIVMEYCVYGDLKQLLMNEAKMKRELNENMKKLIAKQLAMGIEFMHLNGIIHRDLKLCNVLLKKEQGTIKMKITDFGFSRFLGLNEIANEPYGSLLNAAPEIIMNKYYGMNVDIWSYGIILYVVNYGDYPFKDASQDKSIISDKICNERLSFPEKRRINRDLELLIIQCTNKNSLERININDICKLNLIAN